MPRWRGDGKELFFIARGGSLMSVDMTSDTATPAVLFQLPGSPTTSPATASASSSTSRSTTTSARR